MVSQGMLLAVILVSFMVATSIALEIKDCSKGSHPSGALGKITIGGCDLKKDPYCTFVREKNATIEIDFKTTRPFSAALLDVHGIIGIVPVPFPMRPNNACGNYGVHCPAKENDEQKLIVSMPILKVYPTISLRCQVKLYDESNNPIICVEFPIKITK